MSRLEVTMIEYSQKFRALAMTARSDNLRSRTCVRD